MIFFVFYSTEEFDEGYEEEAEDKSYYYGFDGELRFDGLNRRNGIGSGGFFGGGLGFGLGGLVIEGGGGAVAVLYFLAVGDGGEACGVAGGVGLDGDCGGFSEGVVDGKGDGFNHGVVDGFIVGLLRDGLAASATHCKQGKRRYEGSR